MTTGKETPQCEYCRQKAIGRITPYLQPAFQHDACGDCIETLCAPNKGRYIFLGTYADIEIQRLHRAVDDFANAMKERLEEKQKEGYTGWDEIPLNDSDIPERMLLKAQTAYPRGEGTKRKDMVDVANFAMMVWRKL